MKAALLIAAALVVVCGCKKRSGRVADADLARAIALRDNACRCTDAACAAKVIGDFQKAGGIPKQTTAALVEAHDAAMACIAKAQQEPPPPDAPPENLPAVPGTLDGGALLASARAWQQTNAPEMGIAEVKFDYVEANGALDAQHGMFAVSFGPLHQPADDPKRKTGAPIAKDRPRPTICPTLMFGGGVWQRHDVSYCQEAPTSATKCSVAEVWKRAIATKYLKTPADALAIVKYQTAPRPMWRFSISDELRKVSIDHFFDDDCEMSVEKSPQ